MVINCIIKKKEKKEMHTLLKKGYLSQKGVWPLVFLPEMVKTLVVAIVVVFRGLNVGKSL